MTPIRVLLADDHHLVRAGISALLKNVPGLEVVAEAEDGQHALQLIKEHRPDLAILDIHMPGLDGLEVTARSIKNFPDVRIIILSMNTTEEFVLRALRAGASGYLLKNSSPAELEQAIRAVHRGDVYLASAVSRHVVSAYIQRVGPLETSLERLTSRQREVLQLIAEGKTTKEIARLLDLSTKTVEVHRADLMQALNIFDVAGLVRYAIRMGIVSADK